MNLRRVAVLILFLALLLPASGNALAGSSPVFPSILSLPDGFRPEGTVIGDGTNFYTGSLGTGAIYRGNLRTGQGGILVPPQAGRVALGLGYDPRSNYLFVAGGPTGAAYVYDAANGRDVATFQFATGDTFVNDVIVTRQAAYFTDSFRPFLYRVPLSRNGRLPSSSAWEAIPLSGDFVFVPGGFNANGIDATPNGKWLVIVNTTTGDLFRVNPQSGQADLIDLGGASVPDGDGILLDGKTLYVVQNFLNQVAVINLDPGLGAGKLVRTIHDPAFRIPTGIDQFGNALYVVNARFDTPPTPNTEYEVVRIVK